MKLNIEDILIDLKLLKDQLAEVPNNAVPNIDDILRHHVPTLITNLEWSLKRIAELELAASYPPKLNNSSSEWC